MYHCCLSNANFKKLSHAICLTRARRKISIFTSLIRINCIALSVELGFFRLKLYGRLAKLVAIHTQWNQQGYKAIYNSQPKSQRFTKV